MTADLAKPCRLSLHPGDNLHGHVTKRALATTGVTLTPEGDGDGAAILRVAAGRVAVEHTADKDTRPGAGAEAGARHEPAHGRGRGGDGDGVAGTDVEGADAVWLGRDTGRC